MALIGLSNAMFYPRLSGDLYINPLTDLGEGLRNFHVTSVR
jgi:hypothetical protein